MHISMEERKYLLKKKNIRSTLFKVVLIYKWMSLHCLMNEKQPSHIVLTRSFQDSEKVNMI